MTKSRTVASDEALSGLSGEFSLFLGGPLFQLLRRTHLADDALTLARRRVIAISLIAWLPLAILSALQGRFLGNGISVPFLNDLEAHVRFLVATPFLIGAELVVHQRMRRVVKQFLAEQLIPESAKPQFNAALAAAMRLRNSVLAEVLMIALVCVFGFFWRRYLALDTETWYATPSASGLKLTLAGDWYLYLSLPLFQFLLVRWYFRLFVWTRFLWALSRIDLVLFPTHPDRTGGLGFLSNVVYAFVPLALAHGALLAGRLAPRIVYLGATLTQFKAEIALMVVFVLLLVFTPNLLFIPKLTQAKFTGLAEYGVLGQRYVREFDKKWLRGEAPADEPFVGSADIQSLADLGNSVEVVRSMRVVPITRAGVFLLVGATLAPVVPLALTMMPAEELFKQLVGVLL